MNPVAHIAVSIPVAAGIGVATASPFPALVALGTGVLIDLDHVLDYAHQTLRQRQDIFWVFLHAWELLALLLILCWLTNWNPYLLGAAAGYGVHLLSDQLTNSVKPLFYSLIYRTYHRFDPQKALGYTPTHILPEVLEAPLRLLLQALRSPRKP